VSNFEVPWCAGIMKKRVLLPSSTLGSCCGEGPKLHYAIRPVCRDLCITCAHNAYSRTLSSLEDDMKMASKGRNMQLSSIVIKTS